MIAGVIAADGAHLEAAGLAAVTASALLAAPEFLAVLLRRSGAAQVPFDGMVTFASRVWVWGLVALGSLLAVTGIVLVFRDESPGQALLAVGLSILVLSYSLMALGLIAAQLHQAVRTAATTLSSEERIVAAGLLFIVGSALQFIALM